MSEDFILLQDEFRQVIQAIAWPVIIVGILANIGVVVRIVIPHRTTNRSNLRPLYRSSLVSLAAADLLMLTTTGTNILANVSGRTHLWKLPSSACFLIPFLQTVAMIVTSLNLAFVATDRFQAIRAQVPPSSAKSPSSVGFLIATVVFTWGIALGSSYPVLNIYNTEAVTIINNSTTYPAMLCLVNDRQSATTIYTALFTVIFLPLAAVFIVVYILLALNIHRKKIGNCQASESTISQEISTASTSMSNNGPRPVKKKIPKHVMRKRRTVRVILTLIGVFVLCRMPQWSFLLVKLYVKVSHKFWWHLQVVLTLLSLINAAVHPFLYAFLNEALSLVSWINSLCLKKTTEANSVPEIISIKIPRGPYVN
ncbi:GSCOCG00008249001-RA-CDS [Cotesia congregata]|nr:GSCOCG00008249001-RA-CDS [Cotesia congregata]